MKNTNAAEKETKQQKALYILQVKADLENTRMRTKQIRMEMARRNVEVLFKVDSTGESFNANIAVLKEI